MSDGLTLSEAATRSDCPTQGTGWRQTSPAPFGCFDALRRSWSWRSSLCVHAGLWALTARRRRRPDFAASSPASPTRRSTAPPHPDSGKRLEPEQIRADLKCSRPTRGWLRTYSSTGGVELVPADRQRVRPAGHGRRLDRQGRRTQRARNSRGSSTSPASIATSTASWSATKRSTAASRRSTSSSQMIQRVKRESPVAGHHRRNLERLDRSSRARLGGRLHRRTHPALLGRLLRARRRSIRPSSSTTSCASAYPGKRIVIAEFGWPSAGYNLQDANPGRIEQATVLRDFVSRAEALWHRLQHRRSDRPAVEDLRRRRRSVLGHVRRLARSRNSPGPAPITDPDHWKLARHRAAARRAAVAADPGDRRAPPSAQAALLAAAANAVGAWFATVFAYLERPLLRAGRGLRARPRHRAADPADR